MKGGLPVGTNNRHEFHVSFIGDESSFGDMVVLLIEQLAGTANLTSVRGRLDSLFPETPHLYLSLEVTLREGKNVNDLVREFRAIARVVNVKEIRDVDE